MGRPRFQRGNDVDHQLEDLIETASWKQALALAEKRIKKGDNSDAALVCSADSLCFYLHLLGINLRGSDFAELFPW